MSDRYTVKAPKGAAIWATALSESITKCFNSLSEEIKEEMKETNSRIQHIDSKFDRLSETILAEVKQANDTAKEAMNIAVAAQASCAAMEAKVSSLEKSVFKLTVQNRGLKEDNSYLHRRSDNQDSYSRRENLVIRGVGEEEADGSDSCKRLAKNFFVTQLHISEADVNAINIVRCHRLGKRFQHGNRPIIVRFQNYADREMVWNKRSQLKNKPFTLHENYASEVEYRRRLMYPILSAAKRSDKYNRVYLNGDVLRINGIDYTVDDLDSLPEDLHPSKFSLKENDDCIVFGGIHSPFNYLSNFYRGSLNYRSIDFDDLESAYQYAKAMEFGDTNTGEKILCSKSPSAAKRLGSSIKNFKFKDWDKVKEDIMLQLLRIKFAPGTELALKLTSTTGKSLAEAGRSVVYSIGMPISNKDIFNKRKWTKNLLGKMLMQVRQELQ